jgi:hypothetical protein
LAALTGLAASRFVGGQGGNPFDFGIADQAFVPEDFGRAGVSIDPRVLNQAELDRDAAREQQATVGNTLIPFLQNVVGDVAFGDSGIGQMVREAFAPEPGTDRGEVSTFLNSALPESVLGVNLQQIGGFNDAVDAIVHGITNFQMPGTEHLAPIGEALTERQEGGGPEVEPTDRGGGRGPTLIEYLTAIANMLAEGNLEGEFETLGAPPFGFGGGGFGGFGFPSFGIGSSDAFDPQFWLSQVRWII